MTAGYGISCFFNLWAVTALLNDEEALTIPGQADWLNQRISGTPDLVSFRGVSVIIDDYQMIGDKDFALVQATHPLKSLGKMGKPQPHHERALAVAPEGSCDSLLEYW